MAQRLSLKPPLKRVCICRRVWPHHSAPRSGTPLRVQEVKTCRRMRQKGLHTITDNREALCGFSVCLTHGSHTFGSPRSPASSRLPETRRAGWQGRTTGSAVSRLTPFPRQELPKSLSLLRTPPASAAVLGLQGTTACGFPACEPHVRRIGSPPCVSIVRNARGAGKAQKHLPESCA